MKEIQNNEFERPGTNRERILYLLLILILLILAIWALFFRRVVEVDVPEFYVRSQVVVVGDTLLLDDVISDVESELEIQLLEVELDGITPPDFLRPSQQNNIEQGSIPNNSRKEAAKSLSALQPDEENTSDIHLYRFVPNDPNNEITPEEVSTVINRIANEKGSSVVSDPNYRIGRPAIEIEGDPHSGEGAAVSAGSPAGAEIEFLNQWALDERGIQLFNSDTTDGSRPESNLPATVTGSGVFVAMFDTSPFDLDTLAVDFANTNVQHFEVAGIPDARDHGIFGASLIHVIAPDSQIFIFRVLNESNQGDLATLLRALDSLISQYEQLAEDSRPPLVVNLSLTVSVEPSEEDGESDTSVTVNSLDNKLMKLRSLGAVIVGAAGNDSSEQFRNGLSHLGSGIPASYPYVIGVGASNVDKGMSCFSNIGDIYAPGGDNGAQCSLNVLECRNDPSDCIVGYSVHISPITNYAYWNGTSFSAPIVSGVAALLLSIDPNPDKVYAALMDSTTETATEDGETLPILNVNQAIEAMQ